jgi:SpoVK/Ycf46/Vps4 family AAA+-type ATPase
MPSWKGVLLFGPAGVGKSSLIKSIVSSVNEKYKERIKVHLFECSASGIVNKYRGESEKILKGVFSAARSIKAPVSPSSTPASADLLNVSIIFIDELDSIFSSTAHDESSSRLRVELLKHIDGVESVSAAGNNRVIVVGATNRPWDLGDALVRRFEKRCYIALPEEEDRRAIVDYHLAGVRIGGDVDREDVVRRTAGLSGADLKVLCREACMGPLRRFLVGVSPKDFTKADLAEITPEVLGMVEREDFERAVMNTRRTVGDVKRLETFDADFGSR